MIGGVVVLTKCVTYKQSKTLAVADETIHKYCINILESDKTPIKSLQSLLGCLCYRSVFAVPAYELEDGRRFTIEDIIRCIPGLFRFSLRDYLNVFGEAISDVSNLNEHLNTILKDTCIKEELGCVCKEPHLVYMVLLKYQCESQNLQCPDFYSKYQEDSLNIDDMVEWYCERFGLL